MATSAPHSLAMRARRFPQHHPPPQGQQRSWCIQCWAGGSVSRGSVESKAGRPAANCGLVRSHRARLAGPSGRQATRRAAVSVRSSSVPEKAVLAIDVGTTALKAALVLPDGRLKARASEPYENGTQTADGGQVEQMPDDWVQAAGRAASSLLAATESEGVQVAAIALSGQMQDVVLVKGGRALRSALLYSDVRAEAEAQLVERTLGSDRVAQRLVNFKGAAACLAKWLWLRRNEPGTLEAAETILLGAHSYVAYCLTGKAGSDVTTASTTGLLAPGNPPQWATEEIADLQQGLDPSLLPPLPTGAAAEPIGRVSAAAAADLGQLAGERLAGIPVFHGMGDVASTTIGATGLGQGGAYMYLGTSGWIAATQKGTPAPNSAGVFELLHPGASQLLIRAASMTTAGGNIEWARNTLFGPGCSLEQFDTEAAAAPPGSGGLIYMPHLQGERSPFLDPSARAGFLNISASTSRAHMARAVLEGVALGYRSLADTLGLLPNDTTGSGAPPPLLPMVGGGAKSALWTKILADVMGCPILPLPDTDAVAARGCAAPALAALGLWGANGAPPEGFFPVSPSVQGGEGDTGAVFPAAGSREVYDRHYDVFCKLYQGLLDTGVYGLSTPLGTD